MRNASIVAAVCAFGAATFAMIPSAHALGPVDVEVAARAGYATNPASSNNGVSPPNALGFGVGARGGVSFLGIYGGINVMYYFGGSTTEGASALGTSVSATVSNHTFMYGLEAGYGFTLIDILTIRPQIGVGNASFSGSTNVNGANIGGVNINVGGSQSGSNLYLEPGVTGLVSLGGLFVGADANLLFFPGLDNSTTAFSFHGQVGFKF